MFVIKFLRKQNFINWKQSFYRLSPKTLKLIRNELLRNKYTLGDKSNGEIYKEEIKMLREELKSKDFIMKDLL